MSLSPLIPKAYAGHHPPVGELNAEVQVPTAAPYATDSASASSNPPVLLVSGILIAICIGVCFYFARKK